MKHELLYETQAQFTDWAAYSSKLDIWYNYHGEYRDE